MAHPADTDPTAGLARGSHERESGAGDAVVLDRRDLLRLSGGAAALGLLATRVVPAEASPAPGSTSPAHRAQDVQKNASLAVPFNPFGQQLSLHPHRAPNWGPFWVMLPNVWSGLLGFNEKGDVVYDLAKSIAVADGGKTYELKLRSGLKYANGHNVVAGHFTDSWKAALDDQSLAPMSMFMSPVVGYDAYITGDHRQIGFEAPDDETVRIKLTEPLSYFPAYLATFVWAVIDPAVRASASDQDLPLKDAAAGQWRFTAFTDGQQIVMEPSKHYWDAQSPSLKKVTWLIQDGNEAEQNALTLYQENKVALADVTSSLHATVTKDKTLSGELRTIEDPSNTLSLAMDFSQAPFDDVRIRRALATSIDRGAWVKDAWGGAYAAASAFTPPAIVKITGYDAPAAMPFDANKAKSLLKDAGISDKKPLPQIVLYLPAEQSGAMEDQVQALLKMIETNSGIAIRLDATKTADQIQALQQDNGGRQIDLISWWVATDTPSLLSYACRSDSPYMDGWFNWNSKIKATGGFDPGKDSKTFDDLVARGDQELDATKRNGAYHDAEALLLNNAVYVPLAHMLQMYVQKPWLKGTRQGPWSGSLPVRFDKNVVVLKH
jgi:ABC-type transport system substrate-binding protein